MKGLTMLGKIRIVWLAMMTLVLVGCRLPAAQPGIQTPATAVPRPMSEDDLGMIPFMDSYHKPGGEGWYSLFNGKDLTGWVARKKNVPMSWKVVDGVLKNTTTHDGTDIYTEAKFDDFELYYEYRIPPGSNSGVYLRGRYEIQILDDAGTPPRTNSNGAIYSLCAPSRQVSAKPDEWQCVRAKIIGRKVTIILNLATIIDGFTVTKPSPAELDRNEDQSGPILLQGNHGVVEFRYIVIRPLKGSAGN